MINIIITQYCYNVETKLLHEHLYIPELGGFVVGGIVVGTVVVSVKRTWWDIENQRSKHGGILKDNTVNIVFSFYRKKGQADL